MVTVESSESDLLTDELGECDELMMYAPSIHDSSSPCNLK